MNPRSGESTAPLGWRPSGPGLSRPARPCPGSHGAAPRPVPAGPTRSPSATAWEKFLATAEIVKSERIGEGVTNPWKLTLRAGGSRKKAVWKNPTGLQNWKFEIAAYRLDKLLGLDMLPPAVEREFNGKRGALVLWVDSKTSLLKLVEDNEKARNEGRKEDPSPDFEEIVGRGKYITRIWDCLIANEDRTQENILYSADWRTLLIDHAFAFRLVGRIRGAARLREERASRNTKAATPILIKQAPRDARWTGSGPWSTRSGDGRRELT